jgi:hypothetical protein
MIICWLDRCPTTIQLQSAAEFVRDNPGCKKRHILRHLGLGDDAWTGLRRALEESSLAVYLYYPTGWFSPLNSEPWHEPCDHVKRCAEINMADLKEINRETP